MESSTPKENTSYDWWEQSNYLNLMLMESQINKRIIGFIVVSHIEYDKKVINVIYA